MLSSHILNQMSCETNEDLWQQTELEPIELELSYYQHCYYYYYYHKINITNVIIAGYRGFAWSRDSGTFPKIFDTLKFLQYLFEETAVNTLFLVIAC